ncbi:FkbM family methyltransferase [Solemya velum gill symbiont]|uniref:FkbM family methyltransferase n=1 Tax=Solemya velum gill symbiont TaxID=2340 RepID=UPI0009980A33|nr:FkbM family methyltransferase [Solemya velum gill symbiont]OOY96166.1 hypothetical protein BOW19_11635 [Solemya velum gill symbiont]OOY98447.1 hypothetical protein BOW20_11650 [Solemya velum gill symbiont]OOZ00905.1 hypothetical protein BOW21_11695 [Solemya velum gill symbiont]OOZ02979.1 hypothetical protein BOW22_11620 [Solemya velum gill symbiont]OOZ05182.1 hypothetical protein BOW23_11615 [Solemya velum gill symbiont]
MAHPFTLLKKRNLSCTGVLQVGASYGQEVEAIADSGASISILVEALPEQFKHLSEKISKYQNIFAVNALCSDKSGELVDFNIASNTGMSSSLLKPGVHERVYPEVKFISRRQFKTISVDDLFSFVSENVGGSLSSINTMLMDVQGAEHLVLKGASSTLKQIDYIFCEVSYGGLYEGDYSLEELQGFLMKNDYRLCWLSIKREGWGDALFVRSHFFDIFQQHND